MVPHASIAEWTELDTALAEFSYCWRRRHARIRHARTWRLLAAVLIIDIRRITNRPRKGRVA
jgi:hypothetical protein